MGGGEKWKRIVINELDYIVNKFLKIYIEESGEERELIYFW